MLFWGQSHGRDAGPVTGPAAPAFRMRRPGGAVDQVPLREDGDVAPGMPIIRRDEMDGTVLMPVIVPLHERGDPPLRLPLRDVTFSQAQNRNF